MSNTFRWEVGTSVVLNRCIHVYGTEKCGRASRVSKCIIAHIVHCAWKYSMWILCLEGKARLYVSNHLCMPVFEPQEENVSPCVVVVGVWGLLTGNGKGARQHGVFGACLPEMERARVSTCEYLRALLRYGRNSASAIGDARGSCNASRKGCASACLDVFFL